MPLSTELYSQLIDHGFRRSGEMIYRPACKTCQRCIPLRIPVDRFAPRRSQRRVLKKWAAVEIRSRAPVFDPDHFALYARYLAHRHPSGEMSAVSEQGFISFLSSNWCKTEFVEFRLARKLVALAVVDRLAKGLSAVYTCFDPDFESFSPGVFAVLWQIEESRRRGLDWLYLGYWVPGCRKMDYKDRYRPLQAYVQGRWREYSREQPIVYPE